MSLFGSAINQKCQNSNFTPIPQQRNILRNALRHFRAKHDKEFLICNYKKITWMAQKKTKIGSIQQKSAILEKFQADF